MSIHWADIATILGGAALIAVLFGLELVYFKIADKFGIADDPAVRHEVTRKTPTRRGGGIIVWIATAIWFVASGFAHPWFFAGLTLVAGISFVDDLKGVANKIRLACQFAAALMMFQDLAIFSSQPWILTVVALIFCVGIINAYNFMDGVNGITALYSLVALGTLEFLNLAPISPVAGNFVNAWLIFSAFAAVAVFAFFNCRVRAKCFAGDVGAIAIAFIILFGLGGLMIATSDVTWIILLVVYGVDSSLTLLHRLMLHENIGQAHQKHIFQMMADKLHVPHMRIAGIYAGTQLAISAGFIAIYHFGMTTRVAYCLAVGIVLSGIYIWFIRKYFTRQIWLSSPHLSGEEGKYLSATIASGWIAPAGPNLSSFEARVIKALGGESDAEPTDAEPRRELYGVAVNAGTAAIHLGLIEVGISAGDEVICQSFTFAASANPVVYCGGTPVFVDSEPDTWNMDPALMEKAILDRKEKTGKFPKAIVPVHLYGMPAKIGEICAIAKKYGIPVVEDAAEALGSKYRGRACGTFGDFGAISFNGNKIVTTSAGGIAICHSREMRDDILKLATQAKEPRPYYHHERIGYNYRMSGVCAGIGLGQMNALQDRIERRREIHEIYTEALSGVPGISVKQAPSKDFFSNFWLTCILIDPEKFGIDCAALKEKLDTVNIESRRLWKPMHLQPVYAKNPFYKNGDAPDGFCGELFAKGLCLPSGTHLSNSDIERVVRYITEK